MTTVHRSQPPVRMVGHLFLGMAHKRKGRRGKQIQCSPGVLPAVGFSIASNASEGGKRIAEMPTAQLSSLALVLASTIWAKCKTEGSLVQVNSVKGVVTCCACCGLVRGLDQIKRIENKRREIDWILGMEEAPSNGGNSEDGSDIEMTEEQWTKLKELGNQLGDKDLREKLRKMEGQLEEQEKTLGSHNQRLREQSAKPRRWIKNSKV